MDLLPLRLLPGDDLRAALEAAVAARAVGGAFVLAGIGSLSRAGLRFAGAAEPQRIDADLEVLTLSGSIAGNGSHLHITLARADGSVLAGHVAPGCIVRTTAEVLLALLPGWELRREHDAATGYDELVVRMQQDPHA